MCDGRRVSGWVWAGRGTSSCWIGRAHDDAGSLFARSQQQHNTQQSPPMPIHTSAHAHAHARPAYAYPPRTSAPKPPLAHPRCAIHVTCDIACSTLPSPTGGALRNCTAFHNPSARLQPRRMGAELMHSKWKITPCPRMSGCASAYSLLWPLTPFSCVCVCVPTSLTCIRREPQHTPSTASIFCPTASRVAASLPVNRCQKLVRPGD